MTDDKEIAELRRQVATLTERLTAIQERFDEMERLADYYRESQKVDEETMMVISAAVAAVLGHKAKVKQVHLAPSVGWTRAARAEVQDHSRARPVFRQGRISAH